MAVYTEIAPADLARFVARYGLGQVLGIHGIAEGVENTNYRLDTERGRFLLTLYEKRVDAADLPFFLGLMDHLSGRGLNCPVPLRDIEGAMLGALAGRPAAIVTWLDGTWPRLQSVAQCRALGRALAELHLDGAEFKLRRPNALGIAGWRPLFATFESAADRVAGGIGAVIADELSALERQWPTDLPSGVIHADLFPDNAFFVGDRLSGIIDFYFACNDMLAYDVAICLNAWCFDSENAFVADKARALIDGYCQIRSLTPAEYRALPILARGAALRFLLTRAHDWIHTPPDALVHRKDPSEYLTKLRFHQGAAGAELYGGL